MKFGVREICDVVFRAKSTVTIGSTTFTEGQPVLYIDTAKTSTLEGAATTVYAQGGKGNTRLLAWEGEKTLTFTVEDAMLSPLGMSVLTGAGLFESTSKPVHTTVTVLGSYSGTSGTVTVSGSDLGATGDVTVSSNTDMYATVVDKVGAVVKHLGKVTGVTTIAASGTTINFGSGTAADVSGSRVLLDLYTDKTVSQLEITPGDFAGYYYVEASTLFRDQADGADMPAEIIIPKAKIQSNFTFSMASTGDPSTFSFVMDAFPDTIKGGTNPVLCAIQIVE